MSAAAKRTPLVWITMLALAAFSLAGGSAAAPPDKDRAAPTTPTNLRVTAATATTVTLAWDPSQDDSGVVGYYVYGDKGKATVDRNLDKPQYTVSGLACGQSVQLSVIAFDASQNRSEKAMATASATPCLDTQPPSVPSGFTQAATSQDAVVLVWNASSDNIGVVGYDVYRNLQQVTSPTDPAATLSGLSCGSNYQYTVDAVDAAGNRSPLAMTYVRTSACPTSPSPTTDTQAPTVPSGLAASNVAQTTLTLSWNASSDNVAVTGYDVYRDGTKVATPTSTSTSLSGLACATSYTFAVQARDAAGNVSSQAKLTLSTAPCSTSPQATTDTQAPTVPSGLAASNVAQTTLTLSWNASSDNVAVTGYDVYRDGTKVATPTSTSTSLSGLACATSYTFAVQARDAAGNVSSQAKLTLSTAPCSTSPSPTTDTHAPTVPSGLKVASATANSVSLSWNASSDDVGVEGYRAYRDGSFVSSTVGTSATVSALTCGHAYTFEVDAFDAAGNASARASVVGATLACPDTQAPSAPAGVVASSRTQTSIALSWNASTDNVGVVGYGLYRGGATTGSSTSTTGIFSGLACNTNYTLAVDAYDAAGNRSTSTTVMVATTACPDTTPPSAPAGLAASSITQTGLALTWNASTDNVGVSGYDVFRNGTKTATVTSPSSTQSGLACGTSYTFGVVAFDAAGNRSAQSTLTATSSACSALATPTTWSGPITITAGGTYAGSWESTSSTPAVTVATTEPVTITGRVRNLAGGTLIDARITGAQVTLDHVSAYGGGTYQTSGRFITTYDFKSVVVRNCSIENTRGIELVYGLPGSSVLITKNRQKNIQGSGLDTVGNFVQFRVVTNSTIEVSWNEIVNEYNVSNPEDIISVYYTSNAWIHDNYLQHQSKPGNTTGSSQNSITLEGDARLNNNLVENNQVVDAFGISVFDGAGHDNKLLNNRVIGDRYLPNGAIKANGWGSPLGIKATGANNHAHGNVVGYVSYDGSRQTLASNLGGAPEGATAEAANNTYLPDPINAALEAAEWTIWQNKLAANGINLGA